MGSEVVQTLENGAALVCSLDYLRLLPVRRHVFDLFNYLQIYKRQALPTEPLLARCKSRVETERA